MQRILLAAAMMATASLAGADVLVQRWGVAGHVQHPGTVKIESAKTGKVMTFDLPALPAKATIHRAQVVFRAIGRYHVGFEITEGAAANGPKLKLVPPYNRWFDATEAVSKWVASSRNAGRFLLRRGPPFEPHNPSLEIAYHGKLASTPQQVRDVNAFCRARQVFITFREIEDLSERRDDYSSRLPIKKSRGYEPERLVPKDDVREVRYRVYRHDRPITPHTIASAELPTHPTILVYCLTGVRSYFCLQETGAIAYRPLNFSAGYMLYCATYPPKCKATAPLHRCDRALGLETLCSTPEERRIIPNTNRQ